MLAQFKAITRASVCCPSRGWTNVPSSRLATRFGGLGPTMALFPGKGAHRRGCYSPRCSGKTDPLTLRRSAARAWLSTPDEPRRRRDRFHSSAREAARAFPIQSAFHRSGDLDRTRPFAGSRPGLPGRSNARHVFAPHALPETNLVLAVTRYPPVFLLCSSGSEGSVSPADFCSTTDSRTQSASNQSSSD